MSTDTLASRRQHRMTFENFCFLARKYQKADLIKGVMYAEAPTFDLYETTFGFLFKLLEFYVTPKNLGIIPASKMVVRLSEHDAPTPDIMFISKERQHIVNADFVDGAPDLVVEIISPGTAYVDRKLKKKQYAKFGVREYWMIDPNRLVAEFWRNHDGEWETMPLTAEGVFHSQVVSGFWLNVEWLWQEELPDPLEAVTQILG